MESKYRKWWYSLFTSPEGDPRLKEWREYQKECIDSKIKDIADAMEVLRFRKLGWVDPSTPETKHEIDKLRKQMNNLKSKEVVRVVTMSQYDTVQEYREYLGYKRSIGGSYPPPLPLYVSLEESELVWVKTPKTFVFSKIYEFSDFYDTCFPPSLKYQSLHTAQPALMETPTYYDNSKGSLYKIAQDRGWNSYVFDAVKRLDRGGKKDPLRQEVEKTIALLQLWLKEMEEK